MDTLLGIDLGTSSLKLILVNRLGTVIGSVTQDYPLYTPHTGWAEQEPSDWIKALQNGIAALRENWGESVEYIAGIGITGQMHGLVPVGSNGEPVSRAVLWADRRCEEEVLQLEKRFSLETWVGITGSRPNVSFTLPKILWIRRYQPDVFSQSSCFLQPKDYLRFWLTGVYATDETDASATLMFDIVNKKWSSTILDSFGLNADLLPKVYDSVALVGNLSAAAAESFGLPPDVPVVCGAGDAEAQAIGNGVVAPGTWLCTIGTGGQIFASVAKPVTDTKGRIHTLCHGAPGTWHLMGATLSAGMSLQWLTRYIFNLDSSSYNELMDLANCSPPGSNGVLFLPYLFGERTPHMDAKAKGAFIGLGFHHTRKDIVRAVVEGVLFSLRQALDVMLELGIPTPDSICITGGAAESPVWRQNAADVFGVPVTRCTSRNGAAYGAALLAAVAIRWFPTVELAAKSWIHVTDTVLPNPSIHDLYRPYYKIFQTLYPNLRQTFLELDDAAVKPRLGKKRSLSHKTRKGGY